MSSYLNGILVPDALTILDITGAVLSHAGKVITGIISTSVSNTVVVTLTGDAVFTSLSTYQVTVLSEDFTNGREYYVTKESGSQFTFHLSGVHISINAMFIAIGY